MWMTGKIFEGDVPHKLELTLRQKRKTHNEFGNESATDIKLSKGQIYKMIQSGGFLGVLFRKLFHAIMNVSTSC